MNAKEIKRIINNSDNLNYITYVKKDKESSVYSAFINDYLIYKIYGNAIYYVDNKKNIEIFVDLLNKDEEFFVSSIIMKKNNLLKDIKNEYYNMPFYNKPIIPIKPDFDDIKNYEEAKKFAEEFKKYEIEKESYDERLKKYEHNIRILKDEFHNDIKKEFNIENNPKEELLFNLSIEYGFDDYFKVYEHYKKYVHLII